MNCRNAKSLLPLFVGRDLDAGVERDVKEHVAACDRCRELERELSSSRAWLASERPPFAEEDTSAMRRGVWREIEARRKSEGAFRPGRLVFAGGVALAAALVTALWLRPRTGPSVAGPPAPLTASTPAAVAAATPHPPVEELMEPPARRLARALRRRAPAPGVPVKIEFQTANPDVRIIWLVKKGEAAPRPSPAGRIEEVS